MMERFEFKYPKSLEIITHYAQQFDDQRMAAMIKRGTLENEEEGRYLAYFFWCIVDASVGKYDDADIENLYWDLSWMTQFADVLDEKGELIPL